MRSRVSDIHPVHDEDKILKYADDAYITVSELERKYLGTKHTRNWENILNCAVKNNIRLVSLCRYIFTVIME